MRPLLEELLEAVLKLSDRVDALELKLASYQSTNISITPLSSYPWPYTNTAGTITTTGTTISGGIWK